jgi:hypothetical protein
MKNIIKTIIILLISCNSGWGQIVNFADLELKQYLINEQCVDTTHNGVSFSNDRSVDINSDNEIQLSEALSVQALEIIDFGDNYNIKSLLDLNEFLNLKYLKIIAIDSLERISNLTLDSLKTLWISDGISLKIIDISNLPNITTTLKIEGVTTLDTLNIKNGTNANQFSLFYSQNIQYACIDSIAAEINEFYVTGAMMTGISPTFNCGGILSVDDMDNFSQIRAYPNPADDYIIVETKNLKVDIRLFDITGNEVLQSNNKIINISMISAGVYFLKCETEGDFIIKKIIVQ